MARVFLSLGSNLGDRRALIEAAVGRLADQAALHVVVCSRVYETEPWPETPGGPEQWYLNCAVEIETELAPATLLALLHGIETEAGRERDVAAAAPYAPRTLDIDILLYGDRIVSDDDLQIPHPFLHERRFVLAPLAEIAPEVEHPVLYRLIRDLLAESDDPRGVFLLP